MFTDERRYEVWEQIRQHDIRAFCKQVTPAVVAEAAKRSGVALRRSPLCLANLVWLAIAAAMHATEKFAGVLTMTLKILEDQEGFGNTKLGKAKKRGKRKRPKGRSKNDPRRNDPTQVSEEAFVKARQRMPLEFWINLIIVLGEQFEAGRGNFHVFRGFRVMAMDGTRIDLPNYQPLRDHFGTAKNKSGAHNVQARMVMLQFPFTRLPCHYELSPLGTGEVTLALRLTKYLRPNDLVLLDAGYWSYQLLWAIAHQGAFFAIRLRKGVNLKTIKRLQADGKDRLVRWTPKDSRGKWRKLGLPKSIDMRVIEYRVPGFRQQAIVTSVLSAQKISREDWTRLTTDCEDARRKLLPGLYHRRWEIESTYDELKVVQGLDRHLRSRTVESIQYEIAGHVVFYLLVRWLIVEAAVKHGLDPLRVSFLEALRELKEMQNSLITANLRWATYVLVPRLLHRIASHQVPPRPGRHYARKKKKTKNSKGKSSSNVTKKG
jgi:hypothetical protein